MGKLLCLPRDRIVSINKTELQQRIREIHALLSTNLAADLNSRSRHSKALRALVEILRRSNQAYLRLEAEPHEIISIAVKLLFFFEEARRSQSEEKCDWKRRRDCKIATACYNEIVESFVPQKSRELASSLVRAMHKEKLWQREDFCWKLSRGLLEFGVEGAPIIHAFLDCLETETTSVQPHEKKDARAIVRILYQILDVYFWPNGEETVLALERLLNLYYGSLSGGLTNQLPPHAALRKGLEVCVRNAINHVRNEQLLVIVYHMCSWSVDDKIAESVVLDFGSTLEYAAHMHVSGLYQDTFKARIFAVLMRMLSSPSRVVSLLGNRVCQCLLDRQDNRSQFVTPKIFYEGTNFNLKVNQYRKEDKYFLQKNRQLLHDSLVNSVTNHCSRRINLESTYCTICLIAVEIPCGFTAAALVCLAMNLQDFALEQSDLFREASYHVHATVISVLSLLCWIHDAKVFYNYVNKIMMERAQWAPHLNPPLKARYSFAVHHVLWDKSQLFFVDWEARYGLWKCFRLRESQRRSTDESGKRVKMIVKTN